MDSKKNQETLLPTTNQEPTIKCKTNGSLFKLFYILWGIHKVRIFTVRYFFIVTSAYDAGGRGLVKSVQVRTRGRVKNSDFSAYVLYG